MTVLPSPLDKFRAAVLDDPALQQELRGLSDRPAFVERVVAIARERGLALEPRDVESTMDATARAWTMSWMQR